MEPITAQFLDFLTERAYRLIQDDPAGSIVARTFFHADTIVREMIKSIQFEVPPPFLKIISSAFAPTADDFKEITQELGNSKDHWAVYVVLMEKDGESEFMLYVGSGTDPRGCRFRLQHYDNSYRLPRYIEYFMKKGWSITHRALILRCAIPPLHILDICRTVMMIMEGTCTFLLSALYTVRDADFGVKNFDLWPFDERNHLGLGSHSPLRELRGDTMAVLSPEQVEELLADRKARKATNSKKFRQSEKGKAAIRRNAPGRKRWAQSEKGKASHNAARKRWEQSEKGNATLKKRAQTESGKAIHRASQKRYRETENGKAHNRAKQKRYREKKKLLAALAEP